jgi:hypothetical protein
MMEPRHSERRVSERRRRMDAVARERRTGMDRRGRERRAVTS